MKKVTLDEIGLKTICEKLVGHAVLGEPNGGLLAPGVIDFAVDDAVNSDRWQPADGRTELLVLGAEACRDIVVHADGFMKPENLRRATKAMSVPVCNLMDVLVKLLATLNDAKLRSWRQVWPQHDLILYSSLGKQLRKKLLNGPVRKVRNKIGAHLDPEVFVNGDISLRVDNLLEAMGASLALFMLTMNHPADAFAWVRWLGQTEEGTHFRVETMFDYPVAVRWLTNCDGCIRDIEKIHMAEDPRRKIGDSLNGSPANSGYETPREREAARRSEHAS